MKRLNISQKDSSDFHNLLSIECYGFVGLDNLPVTAQLILEKSENKKPRCKCLLSVQFFSRTFVFNLFQIAYSTEVYIKWGNYLVFPRCNIWLFIVLQICTVVLRYFGGQCLATRDFCPQFFTKSSTSWKWWSAQCETLFG